MEGFTNFKGEETMLKILELLVGAINALFNGGDSTVKFDQSAEPGSLCALSKFGAPSKLSEPSELGKSELGKPSELSKPSKIGGGPWQ